MLRVNENLNLAINDKDKKLQKYSDSDKELEEGYNTILNKEKEINKKMAFLLTKKKNYGKRKKKKPRKK